MEKNRQIIKPRPIPYWREKGWVKTRNGYEGFYQTRYGNWYGKIEDAVFYIYKPPIELLGGEHGTCFIHIGNNWWLIHFKQKPKTVSDGILAIERSIEEAFSHVRVEIEPTNPPKLPWWRKIFGIIR